MVLPTQVAYPRLHVFQIQQISINWVRIEQKYNNHHKPSNGYDFAEAFSY